MKPLRCLAYESRAVRAWTDQELDELLLSVRAFNASAGVTGALFYGGGRFFQYLEGPGDALDIVIERVLSSTRHRDLEELLNQPIAERQFETWHMGFCQPPLTDMQALASREWEESMPITRDSFERTGHIELVLYYWNKWSAEPAPSA